MHATLTPIASSSLLPAPGASTPGSGFIEFTRVGPRTAITRARATSPLKLLTPRMAGGSAWVFTSNYGGGLLCGDDIRLKVHAGEETTCLLSTQSSTKIYRSRIGDASSQFLYARIDAGALCVITPDPITCFAGAAYEQRQQYHLDESGSLVLVDWLTSGRRARGERWAFARYASRNEIFVAGRCVFRDALLLDPADGPLNEPQRMGKIDCLATAILLGRRVSKAAGELLHIVSEQSAGADPATGVLCAASPLGAGGVVLQLAGPGAQAIGRVLRARLKFLCALLGDDPWQRKW
jgi:urease accessory protein